jgi:hypothetical protein
MQACRWTRKQLAAGVQLLRVMRRCAAARPPSSLGGCLASWLSGQRRAAERICMTCRHGYMWTSTGGWLAPGPMHPVCSGAAEAQVGCIQLQHMS